MPAGRDEGFFEKIKEIDGEMRIGKSFDVTKREFLYGGQVDAVYYSVNGLSNSQAAVQIFRSMLGDKEGARRLREAKRSGIAANERDLFLPCAEVKTVEDAENAISEVYAGASMLIVDGLDGYVLLDAKKPPARSIEEPSKDKVLRGAKDGFTETLLVNTALIRKRIRDKRLIFKKLTVGSGTKTDVVICYLEGLADEALVTRLTKQISDLRVRGLNLAEESLTELLIQKKWYNPFPKVRYTERPDAAAAMLMEGSVVVLCDNYPAVMLLPTSIFDFLQDTDDFCFVPVIGGYLKLVRNLVFLVSLLLTPVWYTLQTVPHLLPPPFDVLLATGESFLPIFWQLVLVEIAIDGLKLASLNTPDTLSNSLSVISALILGDLAVHVGWLSEQVILYMSFVAISNFTQPSYELGYAFKFMRILTLILIALFSYWGLFAGIAVTLVLIATNNTVGGGGKRGYLYPLFPFCGRALFRLFFRVRAGKD